LKDVAFRYAKEHEKVIPFEINDDRWVIPGKPVFESDLIARIDGRKDDTNKQLIFEYLKSVGDEVSIVEIKEHFKNEMSKKTLHNNLNKLVSEEKIEKTEKGVYKCSVESNSQ